MPSRAEAAVPLPRSPGWEVERVAEGVQAAVMEAWGSWSWGTGPLISLGGRGSEALRRSQEEKSGRCHPVPGQHPRTGRGERLQQPPKLWACGQQVEGQRWEPSTLGSGGCAAWPARDSSPPALSPRLYLSLVLGNVNVTLLSKQAK